MTEDENQRINPFFHGRLEHEYQPILFVSDKISQWVSVRPILFEGVRGSGKSSALRLLSWDVAWQAVPVRFSGSPRALKFLNNPKHIGVYYRVEDFVISLWDRWAVNKDVAQRYFGTYIEFLYLDLLLSALIGIRRMTKCLFTNVNSEKEFVKSLIDNSFPSQSRPKPLNFSFESLREVVADVHQSIRHLVFQNISEVDIKKTYSVVGPGSLTKTFGNSFMATYPSQSHWPLLILLDDCNFLTRWQMEVVNTAVANCTAPISYKLSSLAGLYPTFDTMEPQKPLISDNIEKQFLPTNIETKRTIPQYEKFANSVCKARIQQFYKKELSELFQLKEQLGVFDMENLIEKKLKVSENPKAEKFLETVRDIPTVKGAPQIIKTWLHEKEIRKSLSLDEATNKNLDRIKRMLRHTDSIYERKWYYVAGISLCKEFNLDFPYSGYQVVLYLSCASLRELLRIMSYMWDEMENNTGDFFDKKPISFQIQNSAIIKAAQARYNLIDANPFSSKGITLQNVCGRLGELFNTCQSYPHILTTPETASISIHKQFIEQEKELKDIIRKSVSSGWLLIKKQQDKLCIGLHPILAPKYKISFRSPFYYPEPISKDDFLALFLGTDKDASEATHNVLKTRKNRYQKRHGQEVLF